MKKLNKSQITLGADPEMFIEKEGKIISAVGLIGGTKEEPQPISEDGHAIQEDNVLVEFCIPPSKTKEDFVKNIVFVKDYLEGVVSIFGAKLNMDASAILDDDQLQTDQAKEFGCDPDFNVYTFEPNPKPAATNPNLRSAGGHIHIGIPNLNQNMLVKVVRAMDMVVGLGGLFLDQDSRRRELYGKAGCFRFKDYGLEYRTPSNFWIKDETTIAWAWDNTMEAIELAFSDRMDDLISKYSLQVKEAIDTNNRELAETLLKSIFVKEVVTV